jgi:hypothetical protein
VAWIQTGAGSKLDIICDMSRGKTHHLGADAFFPVIAQDINEGIYVLPCGHIGGLQCLAEPCSYTQQCTCSTAFQFLVTLSGASFDVLPARGMPARLPISSAQRPNSPPCSGSNGICNMMVATSRRYKQSQRTQRTCRIRILESTTRLQDGGGSPAIY